jgi:Tfp pilus assembly protein PilW
MISSERNDWRSTARILTDDRGLSLIELVIAGALSMLVLVGLLAALNAGTRAESGTSTRHAAFRELRDAVDRATGDIRQATGVNPSSSSSSLDIQTLVGGAPTRMIYAVEGADFRRTVCASFDFASPCGGETATLAGNVSTARAFCYDAECAAEAPPPALSLLRITIAGRPAASAPPVTVGTDVQLRNL